MNQNKNQKQEIDFVFFGTDKFSVIVLNELAKKSLFPSLIVTSPDKPAGRGQKMQSSAVKKWAEENKIKFLQPEKLEIDFIRRLKTKKWDLFTLASYGKIIPQEVLDIPTHGTLNVHPSLLPLYRGASPIESAILENDKKTGVSIMLMDKKMDHGPIINQRSVTFEKWPKKEVVEEKLAEIGGILLAESMSSWILGDLKEKAQNHKEATFTKKITKTDGLIDLFGDPLKNFLKVQALSPWPGTYFFVEKNGRKIRVKITEADFVDNKFIIKKVIPEGKKEMDYKNFNQNLN